MKKLSIFFLITAIVMTSFISCASTDSKNEGQDVAMPTIEPSQNGDVTHVEEGDIVNGIFDINGLNIASYRLRGEGPDGAYFDWIEVTEPRVAIADIRRGEWTLYGQGLNKDGQVVVQGKLDTFLSEDSPIDNLVFQEDYGKGDVRTAFAWNPVQVQHPNIEIYVQKATGGEWIARDKSEIMVGNGTAMWNANGLSSGSYIVRAILKDRSTVVSGAAAALRIVDDKLSIGQVRLTIGDLSQIYGVSLDNIPVNTVDGMLALSTKGVLYRSTADNLVYDWFVNGNYLDGFSAKEIDIESLELAKGYHRIDIIVRTPDYGSINCDTIHIFTDGESITEVAEEEVNAVIKDFKATLANEQELRLQLNPETATEVVAEDVSAPEMNVAESVELESAEQPAVEPAI